MTSGLQGRRHSQRPVNPAEVVVGQVQVEGRDLGGWLPMSELTAVDPQENGGQTVPTLPPVNPGFQPLQKNIAPGIAKEQLTLDEGSVMFQRPDKLSADSVRDVEDWFKVVIRRMKRKAGIEE